MLLGVGNTINTEMTSQYSQCHFGGGASASNISAPTEFQSIFYLISRHPNYSKFVLHFKFSLKLAILRTFIQQKASEENQD